MYSMSHSQICVFGIGCVGLSLLKCFSRKYKCIGYDCSIERISHLRKTINITNVILTDNISDIHLCQLYLICVPTPLNAEHTDVDISIIKNVMTSLCTFVRPHSIVVIESTIAIGMAEMLLTPLRRKSIYCGYSPERIDPGRVIPHEWEIPKIISGYDPESLDQIKIWFTGVFNELVPVSSMKTAEMCKLYENCFRMINIAYVNQIADACAEHDINVLEVIRAASTKPFGFMPFYPGLFVGGTCIGINPYYLKVNCNIPLLQCATNIMESRPFIHAMQLIDKYRPKKILIVGIAFKPGQTTIAGSGSILFIKILLAHGIIIKYYDPLIGRIPSIESNMCCMMDPLEWTTSYIDANYDVVAICIRQTNIDYSILEKVTKTQLIDYPSGIF